MKTILTIEGMMCEHCAKRVNKAIYSIIGVESVEVDLASKKAVVISEDVSIDEMKEAVSEVGYKVVESEEG